MKTTPKLNSCQRGYVLLVLMVMVTLIAIAAVAGTPALMTQLKRDREEEMIHRGAQYARAIKRFYRKFGRYPANLDQLLETNNIRFLRQKYEDPLTGKDFRLLHYGDPKLSAKVSLAGPPSGSTPAPQGSPSQQPSETQSQQQPQDTGQPQPLTPSSGAAQTIGGGAIIGVSSHSKALTIREFNDKRHYNEWEFIYDPANDRGALIQHPYNGPPKNTLISSPQGAQPAGGTGTGAGSPPMAPPGK